MEAARDSSRHEALEFFDRRVREVPDGGPREEVFRLAARSGEYRERYLGVKIPPTNLEEHHLEEARGFADALANRLPEGAITLDRR